MDPAFADTGIADRLPGAELLGLWRASSLVGAHRYAQVHRGV
jgi:hypothetical protein